MARHVPILIWLAEGSGGFSFLHVRRENSSGNGLLQQLVCHVLRDLSELTMKVLPCLIANTALLIHRNVNGKVVQSGSKHGDWANEHFPGLDSTM